MRPKSPDVFCCENVFVGTFLNLDRVGERSSKRRAGPVQLLKPMSTSDEHTKSPDGHLEQFDGSANIGYDAAD